MMANDIPMSQSHPIRVSNTGKVTIPAAIRREAAIAAGDKLKFSIEAERMVAEKLSSPDDEWNAGQSAMLAEWNHPDEDIYNE